MARLASQDMLFLAFTLASLPFLPAFRRCLISESEMRLATNMRSLLLPFKELTTMDKDMDSSSMLLLAQAIVYNICEHLSYT